RQVDLRQRGERRADRLAAAGQAQLRTEAAVSISPFAVATILASIPLVQVHHSSIPSLPSPPFLPSSFHHHSTAYIRPYSFHPRSFHPRSIHYSFHPHSFHPHSFHPHSFHFPIIAVIRSIEYSIIVPSIFAPSSVNFFIRTHT